MEAIWSAPTVVFTSSLQIGPFQAFNVGHRVRVYTDRVYSTIIRISAFIIPTGCEVKDESTYIQCSLK